MSQPVQNGQERGFGPSCIVAHADAVKNTAVTATTQTPPSGQFVYVVGLDYDVSADATGTAAINQKFTSTNLYGWASVFSQPATAEVNLHNPFVFPTPIRGQVQGQPVTIVSPAVLAETTFSINIYYYIAA